MLIRHLLEHNSKLSWAVGKDIVHGSRPFKNRIKNGVFDNYSILWVNIEDVFDHTESGFRLDVHDPSGGKNSIGSRVEKAKDFFQSGYMNPSEIDYNSSTNGIVFGDGRHRLVAAYQMGEPYAPVIVPNRDVGKIRNLVRTTDDALSFDGMKEILLNQ